MGVSVNDGDELQPRQRLVSVPFSTVAGRAERATNATTADRATRADQADRADRADRADQAGQADRAADADRLGGIAAADFATVDDVLDLCLTPAALADTLLSGGYVTEDALPALLTGLGYAPGAGFSGRFGDLTGIPTGVSDGDDDTLAGLSCVDGDVAVFDAFAASWRCGQAQRLTEADVDAMVANNGFARDAALAAVAKSGRYGDLTGIPSDFGDGDDDTLATLTCQDGQLAKAIGGIWLCADDADTRLSEAEVDAFVANNGFASGSSLAPVATTGRFGDLSGIPTGIGDGDNDTLGALSCADGQVAKRQGNAWVCGNDVDTRLTEAEVDAFVANNGFASAASLASVATSGRFGDLSGIPTGIGDGDNDTLGALSCADGQVAKRQGNAWVCGNDVDTRLTEAEVDAFVANNGFASASSLASVATTGNFSDLSGIPTGIGDGDNDTLGALSCADGQVAKRQGNAWVCGNDVDTRLTEAEVDAFVANNGFASASSLASVATSGVFGDLGGVPAGLADGDDDTLAELQCAAGEIPRRTVSGWECISQSVGTQNQAVFHTHCAWTGGADEVLTCTPPSCPANAEDLGVTGNYNTGVAKSGSTYHQGCGYTERTCLMTARAVFTTTCAWSGAVGSILSCVPPPCPTGTNDLGVTGNVKDAVALSGSLYNVSSGHQERTCIVQ